MPPAPTAPVPATRVVALLGIGNRKPPPNGPYERTTYVDAAGRLRLPSQLCLAHHLRSAKEVGGVSLIAVGTPQAEALWVTSGLLQQELDQAGLSDVPWAFIGVPDGTGAGDPATFVARLLPALRRAPHPDLPGSPVPTEVVLDITHGFRAQSVLALGALEAAVDEAMRTDERAEDLGLRVLYGAYEARDQEAGVTPIWDLTGLSLQHLWSSAVHSFVRYGRADAFSRLCRELGRRRLAGAWRDRQRIDEKDALDKLAGSAQALADGIATGRLAQVVTGLARVFCERLTAADPLLRLEAPSCTAALAGLAATCAGLRATRLVSDEGLRAGARLARLAYAMDRTSECVALLRELGVLQLALTHPRQAWPEPGSEGFSEAWGPFEGAFGARARATAPTQDRWELYARGVGRLRNDVQHAGLRSEALKPMQVREQCAKLLTTLESLLQIGASSGSAEISTQGPAAPSPTCVDAVTAPARGERSAPAPERVAHPEAPADVRADPSGLP